MTSPKRPLEGIHVIELTQGDGRIAVAHAAKLLSDMGAAVIAIESPLGDPLRKVGAGAADEHADFAFRHYQTGKRRVALDVATVHGRARLADLLRAADVLLDGAETKTCEVRGFSAAELSQENPHLVAAALTPFGIEGPRRNWRGCDLVAQAAGGMLFVNGEPTRPPLRATGLQGSHAGGVSAAIGVLLGLLESQLSRRGQLIDLSLQESVAALVEHVTGSYEQDGKIPERQGSLHWTRAFRVTSCADGYALHCTLGDWTSLAEWVKSDGRGADLSDPRWEDPQYRREHCEHVFDVLDTWAAGYTVADLVEGAQMRRLPYAAVRPLADAISDPQLAARDFFVVADDGDGTRLRHPGAPYRFSATPWRLGQISDLGSRIAGRSEAPAVEVETGPRATYDLQRGDAFGFRTERHASSRLQRRGTSATQPADPPSEISGHRCLDGVRILDFTWVVAGPVATRILADHGAEVIKIEHPRAPDFGDRRGGLSGNLNRGKRSVVLDMSKPRGIAIARELARVSDVVIDNFSARVMRNWGLHYEELRKIRSDVIAVNMSGFGHTGPHRDHVAYGPTLQALAGFTFGMRYAEGPPIGWGYSYSDMAAGHAAAFATLVALFHRRRTGEGQHIDLSQLEVLMALVGPALLAVLNGAPDPTPPGNRSEEGPAAPYGVYRCADRAAVRSGARRGTDRWVAIAVFSDEDWSRFAAVLGRSWTASTRFASREDRARLRGELDGLVESWTRELDAEIVAAALQEAGIAAAVVADAEDLAERDPHLRARGYWADIREPEGRSLRFDGVPFRLGRRPGRVLAPGPLLGEHTDEILCRVLGKSADEVRELREAGVIVESG